MTLPDDIDVRYGPAHEAPTMRDGRPMLTWGHHPVHGDGWTLWCMEDESPTAGVEECHFRGDLTEVDYAVEQARAQLAWVRQRNSDAPARATGRRGR
jgi:hypothetical protein